MPNWIKLSLAATAEVAILFVLMAIWETVPITLSADIHRTIGTLLLLVFALAILHYMFDLLTAGREKGKS